MTGTPAQINALATEGRLWLRGRLTPDDLSLLDRLAADTARPGTRLEATTRLPRALNRAIGGLDPQAVPVRVVAFNKSATANWGVPWHQDRVIAVAARHDVAGFGNWSLKSGTWHCEPPPGLLARMLFVRVFLDDIDAAGGGMQFARGSQAQGIVAAGAAPTVAGQHPVETEIAQRGDILVLNMLTLHRSRPARQATARRVLRIDYAGFDLPAPLQWA